MLNRINITLTIPQRIQARISADISAYVMSITDSDGNECFYVPIYGGNDMRGENFAPGFFEAACRLSWYAGIPAPRVHAQSMSWPEWEQWRKTHVKSQISFTVKEDSDGPIVAGYSRFSLVKEDEG